MKNLLKIFKFSNTSTKKIIYSFVDNEDDLIFFFENRFISFKDYCIKYNFDLILLTKKNDSNFSWELQKNSYPHIFMIMGYNQSVYVEIDFILDLDILFFIDNLDINKFYFL